MLGSYGNFPHYMPFSGDYEKGINARIIRAVTGNIKDIPVDEVYNSVRTKLEIFPANLEKSDNRI